MNANQVFFDKFNQLKKDFAASLPRRLEAIEAALRDCMELPQAADRLQILYRQLHSLGGTAGSFGFTQLGLDARKIEGQISALVQRGNLNGKDLAQIAQLLPQLKKAAQVSLIHADDQKNTAPAWSEPGFSSSILTRAVAHYRKLCAGFITFSKG